MKIRGDLEDVIIRISMPNLSLLPYLFMYLVLFSGSSKELGGSGVQRSEAVKRWRVGQVGISGSGSIFLMRITSLFQ